MATEMTGGLSPVQAFAIVGVAGLSAQWLAWKFRMPAIVLMLVAGLVLGPMTGLFVPARDIGPLVQPMISLAVAVILFEGGLTLRFKELGDARPAVARLVLIGAPLGWLLSTLALHYGAGLGWEGSIVFGGVMIITGPTVIAPLLRQARMATRPAQVLQWEGIANDPLGALAGVLALEIVLVLNTGLDWQQAALQLGGGIALAAGMGTGAGMLIARGFRLGWVPEYMKVSLLFVLVLAVFAAADSILHESGLLAVTVMGVIIANSDLPDYREVYRFKENAATLMVSGVFILLAAGINIDTLSLLTWQAPLFVALVVLVARPATVLISLLGTDIPRRERVLIALTGPRGVVLVAVSGIFGSTLVAEGFEDAALIAPLAFVLVAATVVLHGFTLKPLADRLGLTSSGRAGVILVGGSVFTTALAKALEKADVKVLITDPNRDHLRTARAAGIDVFYGDILGEAADNNVEFIAYPTILAASDNDAFNTLVATDLAPEFGRESIWQLARHKEDRARHALPTELGGQQINGNRTLAQYLDLLAEGWIFRTTRLTEEYTLDDWRAARPEAIPIAVVQDAELWFVSGDRDLDGKPGTRIISMLPPETARRIEAEAEGEAESQSAPGKGGKAVARAEAEAIRRGDGQGSVAGAASAPTSDEDEAEAAKDDPDVIENTGRERLAQDPRDDGDDDRDGDGAAKGEAGGRKTGRDVAADTMAEDDDVGDDRLRGTDARGAEDVGRGRGAGADPETPPRDGGDREPRD